MSIQLQYILALLVNFFVVIGCQYTRLVNETITHRNHGNFHVLFWVFCHASGIAKGMTMSVCRTVQNTTDWNISTTIIYIYIHISISRSSEFTSSATSRSYFSCTQCSMLYVLTQNDLSIYISNTIVTSF